MQWEELTNRFASITAKDREGETPGGEGGRGARGVPMGAVRRKQAAAASGATIARKTSVPPSPKMEPGKGHSLGADGVAIWQVSGLDSTDRTWSR